ncbi:hypothetical protein [Nitrospira sp. Kam-Ns4a]
MIGFSHKRFCLTAFVGGVVLMLVPMTAAAFGPDYEGYHGWIDRLTNEVLIAQASAPDAQAAAFEPYLGQLMVVRTALGRGDEAAVYRGVNRFMDMLENGESGIPAADARRLFDYCFEVTPAKYHDISRHIGKYDPMRWWDEMIYVSE